MLENDHREKILSIAEYYKIPAHSRTCTPSHGKRATAQGTLIRSPGARIQLLWPISIP